MFCLPLWKHGNICYPKGSPLLYLKQCQGFALIKQPHTSSPDAEKKIETLEDFQAYRKADLLRKHQLHPIIAEKVWFIFAQGSYGTAVLEAFKQVEVAVRKAGGYEENDRGTDLIRKAFHTDTGNLSDQSRLSAVKQAMSDLFAGAIGLYKNPSSHHEVEFAPEEAAEIIIIASHLLRIVDSCAERTSNPPN